MLYLCRLVFGSCGLHLLLQDRRRMFALVHAFERPKPVAEPGEMPRKPPKQFNRAARHTRDITAPEKGIAPEPRGQNRFPRSPLPRLDSLDPPTKLDQEGREIRESEQARIEIRMSGRRVRHAANQLGVFF